MNTVTYNLLTMVACVIICATYVVELAVII